MIMLEILIPTNNRPKEIKDRLESIFQSFLFLVEKNRQKIGLAIKAAV